MSTNPNLGRQWQDAWAPDNSLFDTPVPATKRQSQRSRMRDEGFLAKHVLATQAENESAGYHTEEKSFFKEHAPVRISDHERDWKRYSASQ